MIVNLRDRVVRAETTVRGSDSTREALLEFSFQQTTAGASHEEFRLATRRGGALQRNRGLRIGIEHGLGKSAQSHRPVVRCLSSRHLSARAVDQLGSLWRGSFHCKALRIGVPRLAVLGITGRGVMCDLAVAAPDLVGKDAQSEFGPVPRILSAFHRGLLARAKRGSSDTRIEG
ncbi:hypothetical protein D3C81_1699290 [compost metagenome]